MWSAGPHFGCQHDALVCLRLLKMLHEPHDAQRVFRVIVYSPSWLVRRLASGKGLHRQLLPEFCLVAQNGGAMLLPPLLLVDSRVE